LLELVILLFCAESAYVSCGKIIYQKMIYLLFKMVKKDGLKNLLVKSAIKYRLLGSTGAEITACVKNALLRLMGKYKVKFMGPEPIKQGLGLLEKRLYKSLKMNVLFANKQILTDWMCTT